MKSRLFLLLLLVILLAGCHTPDATDEYSITITQTKSPSTITPQAVSPTPTLSPTSTPTPTTTPTIIPSSTLTSTPILINNISNVTKAGSAVVDLNQYLQKNLNLSEEPLDIQLISCNKSEANYSMLYSETPCIKISTISDTTLKDSSLFIVFFYDGFPVESIAGVNSEGPIYKTVYCSNSWYQSINGCLGEEIYFSLYNLGNSPAKKPVDPEVCGFPLTQAEEKEMISILFELTNDGIFQAGTFPGHFVGCTLVSKNTARELIKLGQETWNPY